MPHNAPDSSDFEKLAKAFNDIKTKFGSADDILEAFGLAGMPMAQRYGILFGCLVFIFTVASVLALLTFGGSFQRMAEQAETGKATVETDYRARQARPLLLERLLNAQERLLAKNYPDRAERKEQRTNLTKMLMCLAPPNEKAEKLLEDNEAKKAVNDKEKKAAAMSGFKENYVTAYRKCQDQPGGSVLAGKPEARFEAYARAFASCGDDTNLSYRRSYARLYESVCCESHKTDDRFSELYEKRPEDLVGKFVRLEALDAERHLKHIYAATCGDMCFYKKPYEPSQVWGFLEEGPFDSPEELHQSFVFRHYENQAAFAIVQNLTDRILGVIMLSNDDPKNLSIQLDPPIMGPSSAGGTAQLEASYLLMDRLFAHGYRRISLSIDAKDSQSAKFADRLGFTMEGCLLRHMIIKESSRDSNIYGMLNSDWDRGARMVLYNKLYGVSMGRADAAFNKKEEEIDEQTKGLAEMKLKEEMEATKKKA